MFMSRRPLTLPRVVAEAPQRFGPRLVGRHAAGDEVVDAFGDVEREFVVQAAQQPLLAEHVRRTRKPGHGDQL